ncbi:MAG: hypothetical protein SPL08_03480 [Pseudomonadota bacterium]|nr:hypothetical protein [Pseudomonadota bacterium]
MKNKTLLSLFALAGTLSFQGCRDNLEDRLNTDPTTELNEIPLNPATLTKKEVIGQYNSACSLFFFDLDGNPDTTELVMRKRHCCLSVAGKLNDVKEGQTQTVQEWYHQITQHKGCTSNYYRRFRADVKLLDR